MKLDGTAGQFVVVGGNKGFCESIRIGDDIRIAIYDRNHNGQTRVGIEAPKDNSILKEELYERGEVGEGREKQPPESEAADEFRAATCRDP